ncbi:hypothetical protein [Sphingosinicella sp.]|uniref:hypothetical protein n=1 Tax=Sphingosinicella sp. TaxID=1917971 RepID=UPI004038254B
MGGKRQSWTRELRDAFRDTLAETCNVKMAAAAAGKTPSCCYALKLRDPEFAEEWRLALAVGYGRVEERLIRDACGDAEARMDKYEREQALNLLKFHHGEVGRAHAGGSPVARASADETDTAILKALAAVKKRIKG